MEVGQIESLSTPEGQRLLADAAATLAAGSDLAAAEALRRRGHDAADVAAALTQARLRQRAADKFGDEAQRMFFTPDGLEQATHPLVARRRASRAAAAGGGTAVDLCCGIGSDLTAFARAGLRVLGIDRDPLTAAVARANLAASRLAGTVEVADAASVSTAEHDVVFVDPARRNDTGRVFAPDRYSPPWPLVEALVRTGAIAKLAPGIPHDLVPAGAEAEWVSVAGRLREATLWPEQLAEHARRATVIGRDGEAAELASDSATGIDAEAGPVGGFLYEPDDAIVRAHLVAEFAAAVGGRLIDPHLAYVTADAPRATRLGAAYRIVETLPYREKALRAALRARDVGSLQIKKRGVAVTPEELRTRLRLRGSRSATVVLTRTPHGAQALLVERIDAVG